MLYFTSVGRYLLSDIMLVLMGNVLIFSFLLNFKSNKLIRNFVGPMILGLFIGKLFYDLWSFYNNDLFLLPLRGLVTFSENYSIVLEYVSNFMILIFVASGINLIKDNGVEFIRKYFFLLFSSTLVLGFVTMAVGYVVIPMFVTQLGSDTVIYIDPFASLIIDPIELFDPFTAFCIGVVIGMLSKRDGYIMKLVNESEQVIIKFMLKVMLPLMSIWIVSSFCKNGFENSSSKIIIIDMYLSILILFIQFGYLIFMYLIASLKSKISFSGILKSGMKLYAKVVSLAGNSSALVIDMAIKEQVELGLSKDKAKFISSTSFNMPGSLISNIIFAQGIIFMFDLDVSVIKFSTYVVVLVFGLIIAPATPGSVFAFTSGFLGPLLGFSQSHVNAMGGLYFKQGTSNSALNNASDIYVGALLDK